MNAQKLKALFPNASQATLARNQSDDDDRDAGAALCWAPKRLGSGCEDRFARERLPGLLSGGECVRRQFRVRVSPDDAVELVHYKADFAIWAPEITATPLRWWACYLWEVKDSRRKPHSDELTRPKLARLMNPWISEIWLATWDGHAWATRQLA